jgi:glutamyl/glutaminyl-tRNA synthetase
LLRQSDEPAAHAHALERLRETHHVYACRCTRREIGGEWYPGTCRTLDHRETAGCGVRVQLDNGCRRFEDGLLGWLEQAPAEQCGDLLLRDRDRHWTYQFTVAVDDLRQAVTLVIRGADLVSSTGRQIMLGEMLGRSQPAVFLHHPILTGPSGEKLSKANRDAGVRELRASGLSAADIIGRAAAAVGLVPAERPIPAAAVAALFTPPGPPGILPNPFPSGLES